MNIWHRHTRIQLIYDARRKILHTFSRPRMDTFLPRSNQWYSPVINPTQIMTDHRRPSSFLAFSLRTEGNINSSRSCCSRHSEENVWYNEFPNRFKDIFIFWLSRTHLPDEKYDGIVFSFRSHTAFDRMMGMRTKFGNRYFFVSPLLFFRRDEPSVSYYPALEYSWKTM